MPSPLGVTMQQQEQCNWCWAAVAASLSSATPPKPGAPVMSQCQVASKVRGSACCDDGHVPGGCPDSPCNQPALVQNALRAISRYGGAASGVPDQVTVSGEIGNGRPIVGEINWSDGQLQNHFVMIVDCESDGSGHLNVMIADPADKTGTVPQSHSLDELATGGYQTSGTWITSYFTS